MHTFIRTGSTLRSNPFPIYQYPIFDRKRSPFLYLPKCCKCAVFEIWRDCKPDSFFRLFKDIKCICNPFRAFLQTEKTWFPYPGLSYGSGNKRNPYLFYLKPEKGSPLGRSLPVQTNVGSSPRYTIVGFHMTSLKFKLQNYRSYWDFTFMMY